MITADTITDEQIRELLTSLEAEHERLSREYKRARSSGARYRVVSAKDDLCEPIEICKSALNPHCHAARKAEARARCAEILNARKAVH